MVHGFGGRADFRVENLGASELSRRFGVARYPVIFVGDVLVATPKDFGFYGKGEGARETARYAPLKSATAHERFRKDLTRMIELVLSGRKATAMAEAAALTAPGEAFPVATLPELRLTGLDGKPIATADLLGRPLVVEFWATWCPPCRGTLRWLSELKKRYGDGLAVLAVAVESDEADVRRVTSSFDGPVLWAMGTPELARSFGDLSAVPTLFVFDEKGRAVTVRYGAPPDLHASVEEALARKPAPRR